MDYTFFTNCRHYVGAGKNTLMSTYAGLSQSIFYRKMEKARPMREEKDGKIFFRQSQYFDFDVVTNKFLFPISMFAP